jgi:hypothetical protein
MKLCISNTINQQTYWLGDSSAPFEKVMRWLTPFMPERINPIDIRLTADNIAVLNSSVKQDAQALLDKYRKNTKGMRINLLGEAIHVPPRTEALGEIDFIKGVYESSADVIDKQGYMFFDFYNYDHRVETLFRYIRKGIRIYDASALFDAFSQIDIASQANNIDVENNYNRAIGSLTHDQILEIKHGKLHLTDKGARLAMV